MRVEPAFVFHCHTTEMIEMEQDRPGSVAEVVTSNGNNEEGKEGRTKEGTGEMEKWSFQQLEKRRKELKCASVQKRNFLHHQRCREMMTK